MTSRKCPLCRSTAVEVMKTEIDGMDTARITFTCHACYETFVEVYDYRHTEVDGREVCE